MKNKVIAVVGATASGKTSYAIKLAKELDAEIVSADSRLVYKGMDIGTAKPTEDEKDGVVHHLIDIVEPDFEYSAGLYVKDAQNAIKEIISRGKTPIIVGGTGLYFRILLENYDLPTVEPNWQLRNELTQLTFEELCNMLAEYDLDAVSSVEKNDKKKLIRYIEIVKTTGKTLSQSRGEKDCEFDVDWVGLNYPREILYERINKRVDIMLEQGLLDETKSLLNKYGRISNIVDTIGYKEMIMAIDGVLSLEESIEKLKQNTRNYAKRQLTWFRKNSAIKWNHYPEKLKK